MNNHLLIILFWILAFSCKAPVSSLYRGNATLISAEKSEWFGGRPGVRGAVYTVVLQSKNSRDHITVISLTAEGQPISFIQNNSGDRVTVKGNLQIIDKTNAPDYSPPGSSVNIPEEPHSINLKDNWIEYQVNDSKKKYRIMIPGFISIEPEGELIPRRP